jgi:hypothetical protein
METEVDPTAVADALFPLVSSFDDASLESLVQFRAGEKTQQKFDALSERASDGTLTPAEEREYQSLVSASAVVAVMQAEAEKLLTQHRMGSK